MPHHVKVFLVLIFIAGLSCAAFGAIFLSDLQASYDALLADRLNVVAGDVGDTIEGRVSLGLPLNYLSNLQGDLEQARAETTGIESISVAGDDGNILYSTDRVSLGSAAGLPPGYRQNAAVQPDRVTVFAPLANNFGKDIGTVIVSGARERIDPTQLATLGLPFLAAIGFVALGLVLAYLMTRLFLRDLETRDRAAEADARHALDDALEPAPDGPYPKTPHFLAARVDQMLEALRLATDRVRAMDEAH